MTLIVNYFNYTCFTNLLDMKTKVTFNLLKITLVSLLLFPFHSHAGKRINKWDCSIQLGQSENFFQSNVVNRVYKNQYNLSYYKMALFKNNVGLAINFHQYASDGRNIHLNSTYRSGERRNDILNIGIQTKVPLMSNLWTLKSGIYYTRRTKASETDIEKDSYLHPYNYWVNDFKGKGLSLEFELDRKINSHLFISASIQYSRIIRNRIKPIEGLFCHTLEFAQEKYLNKNFITTAVCIGYRFMKN